MASLVDLTKAVSSGELDGDLMMQIFLKLPVKYIIRFKSVCRSWHALFSSQFFIQHHCASVQKTHTLSLLVRVSRPSLLIMEDRYDEIFSLFLEQSNGNPSTEKLIIPLEVQTNNFVLLGAINGLVCINYAKNNFMHLSRFRSFMLWNPAIKKHLYLPDPPSAVKSQGDVSLGFAYDQKTDSYKVIRIISYGRRPGYKVDIFNTRTNVWTTKEFEGICFILKVHHEAVVVSGVPYWLEYTIGAAQYYDLVWFDAVTDDTKFLHVPCDRDVDDVGIDYSSLRCMGENLALVVSKPSFSEKHRWSERIDIMKLIKYDNGGESLHRIEKSRLEDGHDLAGTVGFGRNGEIITRSPEDNTLRLCDQKGSKFKLLAGNLEDHSCVVHYIQSLVWPSI